MKYFKTIKNGYIIGLQTIIGQTEITEEEYNSLLQIIRNKPIAESGWDYRLKEDLTWELYETVEYSEEVSE
ncbi:MAG: hypothetical protein IKV81_03975 [Clostridia bacterium]|nr:hypothetical protein [Clostridia bacterium]